MDFADAILIGDSRVTGLKQYLRSPDTTRIDVNAYPGANIANLRVTAEYLARHNYYKYIYIFGGVNDVTTKDYWSGNVVIDFTNAEDIHTELMAKYVNYYKTVKKANEDTNIIFLPIIGLDIAVYNGRPRCKRGTGLYLTDWKSGMVEHPKQQMLNDAMVRIKETLLTLNTTQKLSTPLIHHSIHRRNHASTP